VGALPEENEGYSLGELEPRLSEMVRHAQNAHQAASRYKRRRRPKSAPVTHLPSLSDRLREIMAMNDPDRQRAALAAIADDLEGRPTP
jgi:hypothetical protein